MSKANSNNEFDAAFNAFDNDEEDVNLHVQNADCKYQFTGYGNCKLRVIFPPLLIAFLSSPHTVQLMDVTLMV
jgi:hypothetical protein